MLTRAGYVLMVVTAGVVFGLAWKQALLSTSAANPDVLASRHQEARDQFQRGVDLRNEGRAAREAFGGAADAFYQLVQLDPTADAYHDLGNACLLAGRLAEAIVAYHAGLALEPGHGPLLGQLAYARTLVAYGPGERGKPPEQSWTSRLPRTLLVTTLAAGFLLGLPLLTLAWIGARHWCGLAGVCLALFAGSAWLLLDRLVEGTLVVITRDDVPLRRGNGPSYPLHAELPGLSRGMEARLVGQRGQWVCIAFGTGERGWVPRDLVLLARKT